MCSPNRQHQNWGSAILADETMAETNREKHENPKYSKSALCTIKIHMMIMHSYHFSASPVTDKLLTYILSYCSTKLVSSNLSLKPNNYTFFPITLKFSSFFLCLSSFVPSLSHTYMLMSLSCI